ncbi:uracil/xanthine transporter [Paenibacillus yanchengensis]|uniref:Uracil/xanthine transporter n=1 Tax=Paenibacillus yanchengensis TaxID=2035833 RepID=A0ABW4YLS7_9BACL
MTSWKTAIASMQWLFFIFANTIVVPISIGGAFDLPGEMITGIIRSSLIFTGIACMIQALIGHRFPIMEGHSGVMWALVLNLCATASTMGISLSTVGGGIATGLLLAGGVVVILSKFNLLAFLHKIFTPMVMSCFLFLLTFQLVLIFFKGMFKVGVDGTLLLPQSLFSIAIAVLVFLVKVKGKGTVGNYSLLIGMATGWIAYLLLFPSEQQANDTQSLLSIPIFPLGEPNLHMGIIIVTFLASLINLSNTLASIHSIADMLQERVTQARINRSFMTTGFFTIVSAVFGLVPFAPFASSLGFLESTQNYSKKPLVWAGATMAVLGIIPMMGNLMATLPVTVGNAVLFIMYLQLLGTSFRSLNGYQFNSVTIHRLAIPILTGLGVMSLDASIFSNFPVLIQPILTNGFMIGISISLVLENCIEWEEKSPSTTVWDEVD